jgi:REP element-mobilizing transposase RayT
MAKGQWHWQERGTAWKGIGIYHVTLTVTNRQPILGDLVIPNDDPSNAYINESPLGKDLVQCVIHWHEHYPEIRVLQFCLMPDHLHVIVHVQRTMPYGIMTVVRGLWQAAKKLGRAYSAEKRLSFNPNIIRDKEQTSLDPIFAEMPFVRVLVHNGQLETMYRYVRMNPQRLATKRLKPEYFRVQEEIEIADRKYCGVGNSGLLQRAKYMPVHVRRTMVDEADHGDNTRLRNYMNGCVLAARQGTVMVSPFISPKEKDVMAVLLKEGLPFIYIADNGFRDYYKP